MANMTASRQEITSTLRAVKYDCFVPAAEVIARMNRAVNKANASPEGPMYHLQRMRDQDAVKEYCAEKTGDFFMYFIDFPFHKLLGASDENTQSDRPLIATYTFGDPLFAQKIIARNPFAASCIPPRLVVVEHPDRMGTSVYFHTASSIMAMAAHGGERDEDLERILAGLDRKVEAMVAHITAETPAVRATM